MFIFFEFVFYRSNSVEVKQGTEPVNGHKENNVYVRNLINKKRNLPTVSLRTLM